MVRSRGQYVGGVPTYAMASFRKDKDHFLLQVCVFGGVFVVFGGVLVMLVVHELHFRMHCCFCVYRTTHHWLLLPHPYAPPPPTYTTQPPPHPTTG